ncbi:hypothetical protein PVAND_012005 [Polypedilum vanderplanki]|uniref:Uncharacterized protein n=1 Tax=Polypedilum vanderplanki TaxID=319348 RepID=A0A9J6CK97_POLVA|nr:hypothetical protein PVAND_012005 [Polypedilum vanderplanki]
MSVKVESKKGSESSRILSGQFMISHFEQEFDEYQDYNPVDDDDDECDDISESSNSKVLLPGTSSSLTTGASMQLERYKQSQPEKHCEIDSDLSQVFNTLNVTYK